MAEGGCPVKHIFGDKQPIERRAVHADSDLYEDGRWRHYAHVTLSSVQSRKLPRLLVRSQILAGDWQIQPEVMVSGAFD
uniref:DUF2958 domain-containing protein n=1 Tax=Angiostrongylus cantonensis TaxID=6313 RepID=A0A0K0DC50_ANGCA